MVGLDTIRTCALLVGATTACVSDLDTARDRTERDTFGATVVTLACKRVAYLEDLRDGDAIVDVRGDDYRDVCGLGLAPPAHAPDSLKALQAKRDQFVRAIDTAFPEAFVPDLQTFLTSPELLASYDSGEVVDAVDDLIALLRFLADDPAFAPALARLNHRDGYLPARQNLGALRAIAQYPELHEFLANALGATAPGGYAEAEFDDLLAAAGVTLRNAEPASEPTARTRTGQLVMDLLMTESPLLGGQAPLLLVRRDHRGVATVAMDAAGAPVAPFVDQDADGLADIDALGRFVDDNGAPLPYPAPFAPAGGDPTGPAVYRGAQGRALVEPDGAPMYEYVDVDRTLLAALARDGVHLFAPDAGTALDLFRGAAALLSTQPRVPVSRRYDNGETLDYRGFDVTESPLLDMTYAYLSLLTYPDADNLLVLLRTLVVEHEHDTARLLESFFRARDTAAAHDQAQIDPQAPFADELIPVVRDVLAVPGLAEDVMLALEDPALADLDVRLRDYMSHVDHFGFDADQNLVGAFATPVDRTAPDVGYNRSLMQRVFHLVDDADGATLCNKQGGRVTDPFGLGIPLSTYDECELIHIENLALLYVQSMAYARDSSGNFTCRQGSPSRNPAGYWRCPDGRRPLTKARLAFEWNNPLIELIASDDVIESLTTIEGFSTRPTPESLTRALFLDPLPEFLTDVMDPAETKHGERFIDVHDGTLPVFEADNGFDALQPLVQAFADHDAEHLFVALLSVLNEHWASPQAGYGWGSNGVSYEPLVVEILESDLLDSFRSAAPVVNHTTVDGAESIDLFVDVARYAFAPQPGLANRRGETTSFTIEGEPIPVLSPVQLLVDAYALKRSRLAAAGDEGQAWQGSIGNLVDVLLRGESAPGGAWRFANPRLPGITTVLVDFLRQRVKDHDSAGDRTAWLLTTLPEDIEHLVTGSVFASGADFVAAVHARPETRRQIERLAAYMMNESGYNEAFRLSLASIADLLQLALDDRDIIPIAQALGEVLRPERGWVQSQTQLLHTAVYSDQPHALATALRQLFDESAPGRTAMNALVDGLSEVHRARPYVDLGASYGEQDYRALLRGIADFLDDEKRGLRRFISIIEGRLL